MALSALSPSVRARSPRIAHVISTPAGVGGAESVLADLVEGGTQRGWQQLVLNPFSRESEVAELATLYPGADIRVKPCARWWEIPQTRRWLQRELSAFAPDIVHAHLFHALVLVATIRRPGVARLVL